MDPSTIEGTISVTADGQTVIDTTAVADNIWPDEYRARFYDLYPLTMEIASINFNQEMTVAYSERLLEFPTVNQLNGVFDQVLAELDSRGRNLLVSGEKPLEIYWLKDDEEIIIDYNALNSSESEMVLKLLFDDASKVSRVTENPDEIKLRVQ